MEQRSQEVNKVVSLEERRLASQPHMAGKAMCLACRHEWLAVAPIGEIVLDCPNCGLGKGVYKNICCPEKYWQCKCGCSHFFVTTDACICCLCGLGQKF